MDNDGGLVRRIDMHDGKHDILDGIEDIDDLFGVDKEEEGDGDQQDHDHNHDHDH
jgi:hypothetical protein